MTLDLLLVFVALGLMAGVVVLRKPIVVLALLTVSQWYLGEAWFDDVTVSTSSELMQVGLEIGSRLSLPLLGLLLLKRQPTRPGALQILLVVVWAITLGSLLLQLALPVLTFESGYFFNLMQMYQLELFAALVGLGFVCSVDGRPRKSRK